MVKAGQLAGPSLEGFLSPGALLVAPVLGRALSPNTSAGPLPTQALSPELPAALTS